MPATGLNPVKNHEELQEHNFAAMERLTATRWAHLKSGLTRVISCCCHFINEEILSEMVNEVKDLLAQLKEKYNVLSTALDTVSIYKTRGNEKAQHLSTFQVTSIDS